MGRHRIHPEGTTAVDRKRASLENLLREGGRILNVRIGREANEALAAARRAFGDKTDTDVIERLLIAEGARAAKVPMVTVRVSMAIAQSWSLRGKAVRGGWPSTPGVHAVSTSTAREMLSDARDRLGGKHVLPRGAVAAYRALAAGLSAALATRS